MKIAIDGPAGSGKSTIAKLIASKKNITYIDTGAMYRAFTLKVLNSNCDLDDIKKINKLLQSTNIDIRDDKILLEGVEVNQEIRKPEVNNNVSLISQIPEVRNRMVEMQRNIALNSSNVIMDGRDIGTNVLPNAEYKFYLTASIDERAKRRFKELIDKGYKTNIKDIKEEIIKRDEIDSNRKYNPLKKADDAVIIDTTSKGIEEVVKDILAYIEKQVS